MVVSNECYDLAPSKADVLIFYWQLLVKLNKALEYSASERIEHQSILLDAVVLPESAA